MISQHFIGCQLWAKCLGSYHLRDGVWLANSWSVMPWLQGIKQKKKKMKENIDFVKKEIKPF